MATANFFFWISGAPSHRGRGRPTHGSKFSDASPCEDPVRSVRLGRGAPFKATVESSHGGISAIHAQDPAQHERHPPHRSSDRQHSRKEPNAEAITPANAGRHQTRAIPRPVHEWRCTGGLAGNINRTATGPLTNQVRSVASTLTERPARPEPYPVLDQASTVRSGPFLR